MANKDKKWVKKDFDDKKKSRGRRPNSRGKGKGNFKPKTDSFDERSAPTTKDLPNPAKGHNDVNWYVYSDNIVASAANLNYNWPIGIPFNDTPARVSTDMLVSRGAPSTMAFYFTPVPGVIGSLGSGMSYNAVTAPVNIQLRQMYSFMQATVTQTLPFAAADLGIHFMFMDTLYLIYAWLHRLYRIFRHYSVMNRTVPYAWLRAYGLDPDTMTDDMSISTFALELQLIRNELKRIFIPDTFDIMKRHYWLCENIFQDDPIPEKCQYYMFLPEYVWEYDGGVVTKQKLARMKQSITRASDDLDNISNKDMKLRGVTGGELILHRVPHTWEYGLKSIIQWVRTLMRNYYSDQDVWLLNGYILRAFGNSQEFSLPEVDIQNDIIQPIYAENMLPQINNMRLMGYFYTDTGIIQDVDRIHQTEADTIEWDPLLYCGYFGDKDPRHVFINSPYPNPSMGDNLVATRLLATGSAYEVPTSGGGHTMTVRPRTFGTEIVNGLKIFNGGGILFDTNRNCIGLYSEDGESLRNYSFYCNLAARLHFRYGPLIFITGDDYRAQVGRDSYSNVIANTTWIDVLGDIQNFTVIDTETALAKINDAATLGEWLIK